MDLSELQRMIHTLATEKGWWDDVPRDEAGRVQMTPDQLLAKLMLIVSEAAEACECVRNADMDVRGGEFVECPSAVATAYRSVRGYLVAGQITKLEGFPIELADVVIRCLDLAGAMGINIENAIIQKHVFNKSRAYRHGGKAA